MVENLSTSYQKVFYQDLGSFIAKAFQIINPGATYLHNWHLDLLAEYLQAVTRGEIHRLIINLPPRSLKSISVSVAWPAWLLARNPATRIIAASYSSILSVKHSLDCRRLIQSPWYQQLFPQVQLTKDQNEKRKFSTLQNGFRFATSVGGTLTGEGGDILIVDDPHNPCTVSSEKYRRKVINWFSNTFSSRLNDKKHGAIVVVMQRLHENDLTGHLLQVNPQMWEILRLPAVFTTDLTYHCDSFSRTVHAGEFLHPDREGQEEIERARQELGSFCFAAQYQQQPVTQESSMLNPQWFCRFELADLPPDPDLKVLSFDTAIKSGPHNDPTVCTVWWVKRDACYLIDLHRQWLEYPELKKHTLALVDQYQPDAILIEDKASGQSLLQDLRQEAHLPLIPIKVKYDKVIRFARSTAFIEAGHVFLPREAPWLADFEQELYSFPYAPHDDQVDSLTQFLLWIKDKTVQPNLPYRIRRL